MPLLAGGFGSPMTISFNTLANSRSNGTYFSEIISFSGSISDMR